MSAATDVLEVQILNLIFPNGKAFASLHVADPGETGAASPEISGGTYSRKEIEVTITGNTASLKTTVLWEGLPATTIGGVGIWDAATGGKCLVHLALAQSKTIEAGDSYAISANNLTISAD